MLQKYYIMRCKLHNSGIGEGMCCFVCKDRKRPEDPKPGQMCEHEEVVKTLYREV